MLMLASHCYIEAFTLYLTGRQYLSQNGNLVKSLLLNLRNGKGDAVCQENILGCLQKLSLRYVDQFKIYYC